MGDAGHSFLRCGYSKGLLVFEQVLRSFILIALASVRCTIYILVTSFSHTDNPRYIVRVESGQIDTQAVGRGTE